MNPYLPVLFILVFAILLGAILSGLAAFLGPKRPNSVKLEPYESGVPAVGHSEKMSVKYYLTAILFILFDIEAVFLFLWATNFEAFKAMGLAWFGVIEVGIFLLILVAGYIYVVRRGALEWD